MKEVDDILIDDDGACIWIPCENSRQAQSLKMKAWRHLKHRKLIPRSNKAEVSPWLIPSLLNR